MDELHCNPRMGTFKNSGKKGEDLSIAARTEPSSSRAKNQEEESESYVQNSVFSSRTCLSGKPETTGAALEIMEPRSHGNESGVQRSCRIQAFK
jgi:hypothetical protein